MNFKKINFEGTLNQNEMGEVFGGQCINTRRTKSGSCGKQADHVEAEWDAKSCEWAYDWADIKDGNC